MQRGRAGLVGAAWAVLASSVVAGTLAVTATPSSAVSPSAFDVSEAVRYTPGGKVIGSPIADITDTDDDYTRIDAPFPINFYGTRYPALCISTNGLVFPIASTASSCSASYDRSVSQLAISAQAPAIAALALDLDGTMDIYNPQLTPPVLLDVSQIVVSGGVATVTTGAAHGYVVGNLAVLSLDGGLADGGTPYSGSTSGTVGTVPSGTTFTMPTTAADGTYTPAASPNLTYRQSVINEVQNLTLSGTTLTVDSSSSAHDLGVGQMVTFTGTGVAGLDGGHFSIVSVVDADEFTVTVPGTVTDLDPGTGGDQTTVAPSTAYLIESDGVGGINSVNFGEFTLDGRPAYAITWYRNATNDADDATNPRNLSNTVQLVIAQAATGDATVGYDFRFEYNIGTAKDPSDGYRGDNPNSGCSTSTLTNCRWGMGTTNYQVLDVASWSVASGVATVTTVQAHGLAVGDRVRPNSFAGGELANSTVSVASVPDANSVTFASAIGDTATTTPTAGTRFLQAAAASELFATTPTPELIDGAGPKSLVVNSLGTDVLGRYTFGMTGGVVTGFAPPSLGTPWVPPTTTPPVTTPPVTTPPVTTPPTTAAPAPEPPASTPPTTRPPRADRPAPIPVAGNTPVVFENGRFVEVPTPRRATDAVAAAVTPTGQGMWTVDARGNVETSGNAVEFGEASGQTLRSPIVGIVPTPSGNGYWLVGADGGVFAYGDAAFRGSMADVRLSGAVQSITPTCGGLGYYLVASDGGVFAFGDAVFHGSMSGTRLNGEMLGIVAACDGSGYWTYARDGGVFTYGDARFYGSLGSRPPVGGIIGMASTPTGNGYWLIGADRSVYAFGDAVNFNVTAAGADPLPRPTSVTGTLAVVIPGNPAPLSGGREGDGDDEDDEV